MTIETTRPTTGTDRPAVDASPLRRLCGGEVFLPGDAGYDEARLPWSAAVDQRPAAVVFPRSATEVSEVVRCAAGLGLRVAPQSTGHNAGPLAAQGLADVVVVRTSALDEVSVDVDRQTIRVGGGVLWEAAVEAAAAEGFTVLHGSSPDVGVAGYTLGGGIGWYARKLGMAAHHLTAVELVTATGTRVRADADHHAPLFWAVRGGGGSFGVVTALEFRMFPFDTAYGGMLVWDVARAEEVLRTWAAWAADAPDEVSTSFRILRLPPMPELPEAFRGRELVVVDGAVLDTDARAEAILADLRATGPEIDTFARVPSRELVRLHMDPEGPTPAASDTTMLAGLPEEAVQAVLSEAGPGAGTSLLVVELRQLGGALGRRQPGSGVQSHLDGQFLMFACGIAATPEMKEAAHRDAGRLAAALQPWSSGRNYLNFAENPVDVRSGFPESAWRQLTGIRSAYDPHGLFVGNHAVPRLYEGGRPTS